MLQKSKVFFIIIILGLIISCAGSPQAPEKISYGPGSIVAVWNLEDLSPIKNSEPDLGEFITAVIIENLETRCGFQVVEREKLLLALEELSLGSSALASQNTALRLGRLLGAKYMVFGAYQVIGAITRLDLRMVAVEKGLVVNVASSEVKSQTIDGRLEGAEAAAVELCTSP